jgi:hypothetical protein
MTSPVTTYKFDIAAIMTVDITTAHGTDAARQAASSIEVFDSGVDASPDAPDVTYTLTATAPRGRPYLVDVDGSGGDDVPLDAGIPEPIDGEERYRLADGLADAIRALEGDSNDAEHDALYSLAATVAGVLGKEFSPRDPFDATP